MPQRTLIISLGSTGAQIADGVIERMLEEKNAYNYQDACPWIRFVGIDTVPVAPVEGEPGWRMAKEKSMINIGISDTTAFNNASTRLSTIDFDKCFDEEVIKRGGDYATGAALRMRGRAFFLYPDSFTKVITSVKQKIQELESLDLDRLVETKWNRPNVQNNQNIAVFIVGTLGGGTCSGNCIDMAAVIRALVGDHKSLDGPVGIFLVPHQAEGDEQVAKAYFALKELNHFQSEGVVYEQKVHHPSFPSSNIRITQPIFKEICLLKAREAGKDSMAEPIRSMSEFLFLGACTIEGNQFKQKTIDSLSQYATESFEGNHGKFGTFGTASLIYPADHIARAVSYKIIAKALEEWLSKPELPNADGFNLLTRNKFTLQSMREQLVPIKTREKIGKKIEEAALQIIAGDKNFRVVVEDQIKAGFDGEDVPNSIGHRVIVNEVASRKQNVSNEFSKLAKQLVNSYLLNLDTCKSEKPTGINAAIGLGKSLLIVVETLKKLNSEDAGLSTAETASNDAWKNLEDADTQLARTLFWAKLGRREAIQSWEDAAKVYWNNRVDAECKNAINEILDNLNQFAVKLLERLDEDKNPRCLKKVATDVQQMAAKKASEMSNHAPKVNGHVVFDNQTVESTYLHYMQNLNEEEREKTFPDTFKIEIHNDRINEDYARAWVIREWDLLAKVENKVVTYGATSSTIFDKQGGAGVSETGSSNIQDRLDNLSKRFIDKWLHELYKVDVLKLVWGDHNNPVPNAERYLQNVVDAATPFFDLQLESAVPDNNRKPKLAFFYQTKADKPPYSTFREKLSVNNVQGLLEATDPTRATLIFGKMIFPIKYMKGFETFIQKSLNREIGQGQRNDGRSILESRKDVVWKTLDGSPIHHQLEKMIALFLFGIACKVVVKKDGSYRTKDNIAGGVLEKDILKSGFQLCYQKNAQSYLLQHLTTLSQPGSAANTAKDINQFLTNDLTSLYTDLTFEKYEFRSGSKQAGEQLQSMIEGFLLGLLETDAPEVSKQYDVFRPAYEPIPNQYLNNTKKVYE